MMRVEQLRKTAELNLCEDCYKKYTMLLEPQIKKWLSKPIGDWRQVETDVNMMVIKAKGFYKQGDSTTFSPDDRAFGEVEKEKLWEKMKFLKETGILGDNSHKFLDKVSKIRNKVIHHQEGFSERDYNLFRHAKELTNAMVMPILFDLEDDVHQRLLASLENHAKQLLSKLKL